MAAIIHIRKAKDGTPYIHQITQEGIVMGKDEAVVAGNIHVWREGENGDIIDCGVQESLRPIPGLELYKLYQAQKDLEAGLGIPWEDVKKEIGADANGEQS